MSRRHIETTYALETQSPLHIGTGHGAGGLNRAMIRDRRGLPYIPGSTIKGRVRFATVRICEWNERTNQQKDLFVDGILDSTFLAQPRIRLPAIIAA